MKTRIKAKVESANAFFYDEKDADAWLLIQSNSLWRKQKVKIDDCDFWMISTD